MTRLECFKVTELVRLRKAGTSPVHELLALLDLFIPEDWITILPCDIKKLGSNSSFTYVLAEHFT